MTVLIIYDITTNRLRNKIVKLCKDKGLVRIQKSVFAGEINKNRFTKLLDKINCLKLPVSEDVRIFDIAQNEVAGSLILKNKRMKKFNRTSINPITDNNYVFV